MRYPASHKEATRKKLLASARAIMKRGGFGATSVDELMASIGLTGGAFYGHFPSKEALFAELVLEEVANSTEMLAGDESSPPDHVAKNLRSYLSSFHALNPEAGCVLPTLGPEIGRGDSAVKAIVEKGLKQLQKSWCSRVGNPDASWALIAQCVGAILLARCVETERTRKEILASSRRFIDETHALNLPAAEPRRKRAAE
ncbi:AcrR family transcriptional regulator [Pseudacidovorax sp. 1753]|uniref:TetR/AcrR family transcriptional regulator n=1 Tax=Pseudacidovorax sp. 1753 TaxID=3156419 RepID=UPI0033921B93